MAQSAIHDVMMLEQVAAFEESHVEVGEGADDGLEADEFYVESLLDRRISRRTGLPEYLVHWGGFDEDADSWEPAEGLPHDMMEEFDAAQKAARALKRSRR